MSSTTPNIGLTKTTAAETIGQNWAASNDSGGNFDIIDTKMGAVGNTSLQAQVTALNSKLTTLFDATDLSSKITNCHAKYMKLGRTVVVFAVFTATSEITASDTLFKLPLPFGSAQAVIPIADAESGLGNGNVLYIRANGECRLFAGLQSGKTINATGAYISAS